MIYIIKLICWFIGVISSFITIYAIFFISLYISKCIKKTKIWQNKNDFNVSNTEDLKRIMEREIWKIDINNQNK